MRRWTQAIGSRAHAPKRTASTHDALSSTSGRFCRRIRPERLHNASVSPGQRSRRHTTPAENSPEVRNHGKIGAHFLQNRSEVAWRGHGRGHERRRQDGVKKRAIRTGLGARMRTPIAGSTRRRRVGPPIARPDNPNAASSLLSDMSAEAERRAHAPGSKRERQTRAPDLSTMPPDFSHLPTCALFWRVLRFLAPEGRETRLLADRFCAYRSCRSSCRAPDFPTQPYKRRPCAWWLMLACRRFAPSLLRPRLSRLALGRSSS